MEAIWQLLPWQSDSSRVVQNVKSDGTEPEIDGDADGENQQTPLAKTTPLNDTAIPVLQLEADAIDDDNKPRKDDQMNGSTSHAQDMPPPRLPSLAVRNSSLALHPRTNLHAPSNGTSIKRLNPSQSLSPSSVPTVANTAGKRNKVILSPGHSPLDWANLTRSSTNLAGVTALERVTPTMLKKKNGRKGIPAWSSFRGKVYNITPYLDFHPGGKGELMRAAGKDGEQLFNDIHAWVNWDNMLSSCVVGIMVSENSQDDSGLDDMD